MIEFKLSGDVSPKNMPVNELVIALSEFSHIIDKAYLVATNQHRFSKKNRNDCYLVNRDIQHGSFESTLEIMLASTGAVLPTITPFASSDLWELVKNSYDFIKTYMEKKSKGEDVSVQIDRTTVNAPIVIGNNNTIIIGEKLAEIADRSEPHYKALTSVINKHGITEVSAFESKKGFKIGENEKKLFNPKTRINKEAVRLKCDIIRFDKESKKGRLIIKESKIGKDSFKFKSNTSSFSVLGAMYQNEVDITAWVEYNVHSTGIETIAGFHIKEIHGFENSLMV